MVASVVAAWSLLSLQQPRAVSRLELTFPEGVELASSGAVNVAVSPEGSRVVFVGESIDGDTQLWLRHLDQLSPVPILGTENAENPRFSPNGESVAFISEGSLSTVSLEGGPAQTLVSDSVPSGATGLAWGPDGNVYFRKEGKGIWRVPENGGEQVEVSRLAEGESGHLWPDVLPNGKAILFTRYIGPGALNEIGLISLDTGQRSVLFQGTMARYAHSGHIVYSSASGALAAVSFDIERLEVTGSARTLVEGLIVTANSNARFALSETGVLLYGTRGLVGEGTVGFTGTPVWVSRDGTEEVVDSALLGQFWAPAVSPDGRKIALEYTPDVGGGPQIGIYDVGQGTFSQLTFEGDNRRPFWSSNGDEVGYLSDRNGLRAAYSRSADFTGEAQLLRAAASNVPVMEALWTPDQRWLLYRQGNALGGQTTGLYFAAPHPDSAAIEIVDTPAEEYSPSLSPDGRWLAYQSDRSGRFEVIVLPFQGAGGPTRISLDGGRRPVWARNGRELFYVDSEGFWTVATVGTEPDFAVESRERLASWEPYGVNVTTQHYDPSPDDQRLLAIRRFDLSGAEARHVLVQNWFEELKELVGN